VASIERANPKKKSKAVVSFPCPECPPEDPPYFSTQQLLLLHRLEAHYPSIVDEAIDQRSAAVAVQLLLLLRVLGLRVQNRPAANPTHSQTLAISSQPTTRQIQFPDWLCCLPLEGASI
jgi:hypothetical protein